MADPQVEEPIGLDLPGALLPSSSDERSFSLRGKRPNRQHGDFASSLVRQGRFSSLCGVRRTLSQDQTSSKNDRLGDLQSALADLSI